jgi:hypothetical protein
MPENTQDLLAGIGFLLFGILGIYLDKKLRNVPIGHQGAGFVGGALFIVVGLYGVIHGLIRFYTK